MAIANDQQGRRTAANPDSGRIEPGVTVRWTRRVAIAAAIVLSFGAVGYGLLAAIGAWQRDASASMLVHTVQRGPLFISVSQLGNLQSAQNVDIRCQVPGGSTIMWIIEDGAVVTKGDKLIEFESSSVEELMTQQKITCEKARALQIQAEKNYQVAQIAVQEYEEGTYRQQLQACDTQITIALENLKSAQNSLEHAERMFRKGFISPLELESQQFAVKRSELDLASARSAKDVLDYAKEKTLKDLKSQVDTTKAAWEAQKATFGMEETRLKRLHEQLANCVITAPTSGMVVYERGTQSDSRFGSDAPRIELGARVRERQVVLKIPDLSQMEVKMNVPESKVERLKRGQRAYIGILDRDYLGNVANIATQPNPQSFASAGINEYATVVRIDQDVQGLRPGLSAQVEVLVAALEDVLSVPVAAVENERGQPYCWVKTAKEIERRPLVLGMDNDRFVEVKDGVVAGERVLLNTRPMAIEPKEGGEGELLGPLADEPAGSAEDPPNGRGTGRGNVGPGGNRGNAAAEGQSRGPGDRQSGGQRFGGGGGFDLTRFDTDGDGKIGRDEVQGRMLENFERHDTNQDGFIDSKEFAAMRGRQEGTP